jgi:hypothetical protein
MFYNPTIASDGGDRAIPLVSGRYKKIDRLSIDGHYLEIMQERNKKYTPDGAGMTC